MTIAFKKITLCIFFCSQVFTVIVNDAGQETDSTVRMIHRLLVPPVFTAIDSVFTASEH